MASSLSISPTVVTAILVLSFTIVVSTCLCLLMRYFIRRCSSSSSSNGDSSTDDFAIAISSSSARSFSSNRRVSPQIDDRERIDSLPLFTFTYLTSSSGTTKGRSSREMNADCAVCLSKFEPTDELRLLPICCHAFHAECVDTWLQSNQTKTCPLCRSIIFASEDEILSKVLAASVLEDVARNGSFRVEIGNVSRHHNHHRSVPSSDLGASHRSSTYSIGSFDYVVHAESEVAAVATTTHNRGVSQDKNDSTVAAGSDNLAAEVGGGGISRSWLREYVERLSSRTLSFRSSGRFFGSDQRNDVVVGASDYDVEANRAGEEISEMLGWFSGV